MKLSDSIDFTDEHMKLERASFGQISKLYSLNGDIMFDNTVVKKVWSHHYNFFYRTWEDEIY